MHRHNTLWIGWCFIYLQWTVFDAFVAQVVVKESFATFGGTNRFHASNCYRTILTTGPRSSCHSFWFRRSQTAFVWPTCPRIEIIIGGYFRTAVNDHANWINMASLSITIIMQCNILSFVPCLIAVFALPWLVWCVALLFWLSCRPCEGTQHRVHNRDFSSKLISFLFIVYSVHG